MGGESERESATRSVATLTVPHLFSGATLHNAHCTRLIAALAVRRVQRSSKAAPIPCPLRLLGWYISVAARASQLEERGTGGSREKPGF